MKVTTIGIDLAKHVFQIHGVNEPKSSRARPPLGLVITSSDSHGAYGLLTAGVAALRQSGICQGSAL